MLGVAILGALLLYFTLWIFVTILTFRMAARRGYSTRRCWIIAGAAFLVMYLIPFWDWIPTVIAHRYYCNKEAGLFVYKTLDEWKTENPKVAETLSYQGVDFRREGNSEIYVLNQRFEWLISQEDLFLSVRRRVEIIQDGATTKILARYVDIASGYGNAISLGAGTPQEYKFWLGSPSCFPEVQGGVLANPLSMPRSRFAEFKRRAKFLGEESRDG